MKKKEYKEYRNIRIWRGTLKKLKKRASEKEMTLIAFIDTV